MLSYLMTVFLPLLIYIPRCVGFPPSLRPSTEYQYFETRRRNLHYFFVFPKNILVILKENCYLCPQIKCIMRKIAKSTLVEYYTKNPLSKTALEE